MWLSIHLHPFHIDCLKYYKGYLFSKEKTITDIRWPEETKKKGGGEGGRFSWEKLKELLIDILVINSLWPRISTTFY